MGTIRIGVDDTDSPNGMCTTYLGALLCEKLEKKGFEIKERLLIRLNPNAPHKTRGNAAICVVAENAEKKESDAGDAKNEAFFTACSLVEEFAEFDCENTNPGVVVSEGPVSPDFYKKALRDFCTIEEAENLLEKSGALYRGWKIKRGLIGATAAVSADLSDYTYEVLAYRSPFSKEKRSVDRKSVFLSEKMTYPRTWDSVDMKSGVVVCVPHTPDPVLYGIRGESPEWVMKSRSYIVSEEPERECLYRTNQGTDVHLVDSVISDILDGRSYRLKGKVSKKPFTGTGGHVETEISDGKSSVRCMAYEPTKEFRDIVRGLIVGDEIIVCGSYKNGSINLEKFFIESLAEDMTKKPPVCQKCGKRMTSAGKDKGYKCRTCGEKSKSPEIIRSERSVGKGWYEVPPVARRHLSMPLVRNRRKNS
ncbi:tRNA(Ile2)-agmatinylcytidine synthase [Methanomicrobium sp. W14]|uniref:tRNA(Ile)(2)-agmatinylcytidine synthase n=1 Tax=Methanomicrobium sp. W14 TaxID=2817839 RepID=UPI001FDA1382|nr:tRNA(Ile)(2)-agmatinylcytidine synthase [Methanomicrobium sp. W14]MBP2133364.1 tRNA(Ile2)-agmatinylcytidine synthase [Methanomicrobium sp. W14]